MKISIITLFPEMFSGPLTASILKRAVSQEKLTVEYVNLRDYATDAYKTVDDHPYGGGAGMVLKVDVIDRALSAILDRSTATPDTRKIVLMDPQGVPYHQKLARELADTVSHLVILCGHYEGVDERVRDLVDMEISIGDYVLTGGEIPAMVLVDSITRLLPGVLKKTDATVHESFEDNLLEYPQYTRPEVYKNRAVPPVLLSGNHAAIVAWQKEQAILKTKKRRPDLA